MAFSGLDSFRRGIQSVSVVMPAEDKQNAYAEATDGCRPLVRATRDSARQWQRVKPDPEINPLADLDCEKMPTWDEQTVQVTPLRASTCA